MQIETTIFSSTDLSSRNFFHSFLFFIYESFSLFRKMLKLLNLGRHDASKYLLSYNITRQAHFLASVPLQKRSGEVSVKSFEKKVFIEALSFLIQCFQPLLLYFSAGWCRSCKMFTPKLRNFYEKLNEGDLDVVWVSRDKTAEDQLEYYNKALPNWAYIPFGSPEIA